MPDLDSLIRQALEAMAEEVQPDEEEAARIYERVFSERGKDDE